MYRAVVVYCTNCAVKDAININYKKQILLTEKPSKPEGPLEAIDIQRTAITLRWKPPKDDGGSPLTGYVIEKRDAKRGSWTKAGKVDGSTTEFCVLDLLEKSDYYFRVMAVNKAGQSEPLESDKAITAKSPFG